jgi:uncharacterized protein (DUF1499 family)
MRIVGVVLQIVFFLVLIFASLLVAGIISNRLPLNDPPGFGTRIATYLSINVAETSADTVFPELRLRRYEAPPGLLFDVARRAVQGMKWEVTNMDDTKNEIHAVVTTKLWKYKDDVVIQIQPALPSGSWLWVRSSSRVGKGDLGANTRHIMDLVRYVDETVPKQAIVSQ